MDNLDNKSLIANTVSDMWRQPSFFIILVMIVLFGYLSFSFLNRFLDVQYQLLDQMKNLTVAVTKLSSVSGVKYD